MCEVGGGYGAKLEIDEKIINWSKSVGLMDPETTQEKRFVKLAEEVGELGRCILHNQPWPASFEIGDIYVVIVQIAHKYGLTIEHCAEMAYDKIRDRTGKISNGTFIKD